MLLLFCAHRQTCIVDMLSAIITMFTGNNFAKVYKIPVIGRHFRKQIATTKSSKERVQALPDISRSALCCHSNETRAPIANPPNSAQLEGIPTIPPNIRVRAVVWERGEGQTDTQTHRRSRPINISPRLRLKRNVIITKLWYCLGCWNRDGYHPIRSYISSKQCYENKEARTVTSASPKTIQTQLITMKTMDALALAEVCTVVVRRTATVNTSAKAVLPVSRSGSGSVTTKI